jgi:hypothetical protein
MFRFLAHPPIDQVAERLVNRSPAVPARRLRHNGLSPSYEAIGLRKATRQRDHGVEFGSPAGRRPAVGSKAEPRPDSKGIEFPRRRHLYSAGRSPCRRVAHRLPSKRLTASPVAALQRQSTRESRGRPLVPLSAIANSRSRQGSPRPECLQEGCKHSVLCLATSGFLPDRRPRPASRRKRVT